ncbi:hypothetical protein [Chitinophaga rhizophila]|uniref:Uncharacterized protein n=1 Tax=Chitinophaga rhizophila TaxID=2866212 RepID=A0ABS7GMR4_9BACT|nr:hypothetical protein [Chitinophaga rhizophila]MBW8687988.1 hypothetical protein [Chitinophaga rhizophila]
MNRLSLDDFKINEIDTENEIEKMLGLAAAACHINTCVVDRGSFIDLLDYESVD